MAGLSGSPCREVKRDLNTSIAQASAPSSNASSRVLVDNQENHNEPGKSSFNSTTEIEDSQSDNEPNDAPTGMTPEKVRSIIQNDLIKRLTRLPAEYFDRHLQLQRNSAFWSKLFNPPQDAGSTYITSLISREWAEYVVDASHIFFNAGLSVKEVVSIIDRAISFVAICLLDRPTEQIYFKDGRNVFYEFKSRGMPKELKPKYNAFLKGMRASIVESRQEAESNSDEIPESDEDSSDVNEVSQLEGANITPVEGDVMISCGERSGYQEDVNALPCEPSTILTEVKAPMLKAVEKSDSRGETASKPPRTKKERNHARYERRKRARRRQNKKKKVKVKKSNTAAGS